MPFDDLPLANPTCGGITDIHSNQLPNFKTANDRWSQIIPFHLSQSSSALEWKSMTNPRYITHGTATQQVI